MAKTYTIVFVAKTEVKVPIEAENYDEAWEKGCELALAFSEEDVLSGKYKRTRLEVDIDPDLTDDANREEEEKQ